MAIPKAKPKAACKDDDVGMLAIAGVTCLQVKAGNLCPMVAHKMLPDLCTCSCPHSRRCEDDALDSFVNTVAAGPQQL